MGQQQKFCHQCGTQLILGSKYCGNCGAPILTPEQLKGKQQIDTPSPTKATSQNDLVTSLPHGFTIHAIKTKPVWETPNPFFETLFDVIFRPRRGFRKIARSPELAGPLVITGVLALLEGGATYLLLQKLKPEWLTSSGPKSEVWAQEIWILTAFFFLLSFVSLFVTSILLFGLLRLFGKTDPHFTPMRQSFTIIGYARLPEVLFDLVYLLLVVSDNSTVIVPIDDKLKIPEGLADKMLNEIENVSPMNEWMLVLLIACLLWSFVLTFIGIKNTLIQPHMHLRIMIPYMAIRIMLLLVLSV